MKKKINLEALQILLKSMFALNAYTSDGGLVVVSLVKKRSVEELHRTEEDEMLDVTATTQSLPGPLPVSAPVIIGYRMHGVLGSLVTALETIISPMVIISLISVFYQQFRENTYTVIALQVVWAGMAAATCDVVISLAGNVRATRRLLYIAMTATVLANTHPLSVGAMMVILICLGTGLVDLGVPLYKRREKSEVAVEQVYC